MRAGSILPRSIDTAWATSNVEARPMCRSEGIDGVRLPCLGEALLRSLSWTRVTLTTRLHRRTNAHLCVDSELNYSWA